MAYFTDEMGSELKKALEDSLKFDRPEQPKKKKSRKKSKIISSATGKKRKRNTGKTKSASTVSA